MSDYCISMLLNIQTHRPLDVHLNKLFEYNKKKSEMSFVKYKQVCIFQLYYKFIWCKIVTNNRTL